MTDAAPTGPTPGPYTQDGVDDPEATVSSDDDMPALEDIGRDYELLNKRVLTLIRAHENGEKEIGIVDAMRIHSELAQLLMDHIGHTKGLEEHASWASDQIDNLGSALGDDDRASQLDQADAAKYQTFFAAIIPHLDDRIGAENESAPLEQLKALREGADELKALTDEITLSDEEESNAAAAAAPTPDA